MREYYATGLCLQVHPHPSLLRLAPDEVREAVGRVAQAKRAVDVSIVTRVQQMAPWATRTMQNAEHLLKTPSASRLFGAFRGVPAVIAAAGPSLDQQLPLLAHSAGRLLVLAIGQSLRSLHRAGVEPDLCHAIESIDVSRQFLDSGDPGSLSLVLLPSVHPRLFEVPARERFVAYPAGNPLACRVAELLGDHDFFLGGATVAQSAVHLAAAMGANPIFLIGQDLAFTGGRVYARDCDQAEELEPELGGFPIWTFDPAEFCAETFDEIAEASAIVIEWNLQGQCGIDLLEALLFDERTREVPVVLASAVPTRAMVLAALRCGARSFTMKPYQADELRRRLEFAGVRAPTA